MKTIIKLLNENPGIPNGGPDVSVSEFQRHELPRHNGCLRPLTYGHAMIYLPFSPGVLLGKLL